MSFFGPLGQCTELARPELDNETTALAHDRHRFHASPPIAGGAMGEMAMVDDSGRLELGKRSIDRRRVDLGQQAMDLVGCQRC